MTLKMSDQRDPTKWIALVVATISLIVSGVTAYIQLSPRHDFHAILARVGRQNRTATASLLLLNRGNQVETFVGAWAFNANGCAVAESSPAIVTPGSASIVHLKILAPPTGSEGSRFSLIFEITDPGAKTSRAALLFSSLPAALTLYQNSNNERHEWGSWNPSSTDLFSPAPPPALKPNCASTHVSVSD